MGSPVTESTDPVEQSIQELKIKSIFRATRLSSKKIVFTEMRNHKYSKDNPVQKQTDCSNSVDFSYKRIDSQDLKKLSKFLSIIFPSMLQPAPVTIECHTFPGFGHSIPMLRIIQILQQANPHYQITYMTSKFFVDILQSQYPQVKMYGIEDGLTLQTNKKNIDDYGMNALKDFVLNYHKEFFFKKENHPDLMICDILSKQAMMYVNRNGIKCVINNIFPYNFNQDAFSFVNFERSFGLGGFTINYPVFFNPYKLLQGFQQLHQQFRYKYKILFNTAIGLQPATTVPTNHILTGLLSNKSKKTSEVSNQLNEWMGGWKSKGRCNFLYIGFGTMVCLSENLVEKLAKAVEAAGYPTIWSLKEDFGKVNSPLIFNRQWLPQEKILALGEVKAFISHCGWGSSCQAAETGTPIIALPSFFDQFYTARLVEKQKIGIQLYKKAFDGGPPPAFDPDVSIEQIAKGISEVMENDVYRTNMEKVSKICKTYRTEQIVNDAIRTTLQTGDDHLIGKDFEKATERATLVTFKGLFKLFLLLVLVFICRNYQFVKGQMGL